MLDVGCGLLLKREALAQGPFAKALVYLLSDPVQNEIAGAFEQEEGSSLDAERKHQQDKRHEKGKALSVSRARRNSITRRYQLQRAEFPKVRKLKKSRGKEVKKMNIRALAVTRNATPPSQAQGEASLGRCCHCLRNVEHCALW